jgi:hypothetical protein
VSAGTVNINQLHHELTNKGKRISIRDLQLVANQHVIISHQHVEAISNTKQEAKWKQSGSKVEARWKQSGCEMEAKAWNMLEGMVLSLRH